MRFGNDSRFMCLPHNLSTLLITFSSKLGQIKSIHNDGTSTAACIHCET